ncbi:hypothetical protein F5Y15DRAFT_11985 [Xylariaceae sp. FL0016]|nr:hypothetical protein F5Y15DRAFT_11985 [Xylariaceae sp. FL0016]
MSLLSRLRGKLSGYQADVDPHAWRLPTSYPPKSSHGETRIPDARIFRNAFIPDKLETGAAAEAENSLVYPDISHAAVHLALLECFWALRISAGGLDVEGRGLLLPPGYRCQEGMEGRSMGRPDEETGARRTGSEAETSVPADDHQWDILLRLAITRFGTWWNNLPQVLHHASAYAHHGGDRAALQLQRDYLPPLDVLLVWWALMQDEDDYAAACRAPPGKRDSAYRLDGLCFPWPAIRDALDVAASPVTYTLPRAAKNLFVTLSGQEADVLVYVDAPPAYRKSDALPFYEEKLFRRMKGCGRFHEKAHRLLWIRGPCLKGSLRRSVGAYLEWIAARGRETNSDGTRRGAGSVDEEGKPSGMSFGVELMWRTHSLFPLQYQLFRSSLLDTIAPSTLPDSKTVDRARTSENTSNIGPGEACECWTCERIRDDIPSFISRPPDSSRPPLPSSSSPPSSPPPPSPCANPLASLTPSELLSIQDDIGFHRAVEAARRAGKRPADLPTRPPTAAEREEERREQKKRDDAGYRPGLYEYLEVLPDGTRKIRRQKMQGNGYYSVMRF